MVLPWLSADAEPLHPNGIVILNHSRAHFPGFAEMQSMCLGMTFFD